MNALAIPNAATLHGRPLPCATSVESLNSPEQLAATPSMVARFTVFGLVLGVFESVNGGLQ